MTFHDYRTTALAVFVLVFGCAEAANFCCKNIHWGSDWCHKADCLGSGCFPGENSISCSDIKECICRDFIHGTTKAFCTILESCRLASEDVAAAMGAVELYTSTTPSESCIHAYLALRVCNIPHNRFQALVRGVCAYHFPVCTSDNTEFSQVCSETCDAMDAECGITFAFFASVADRCQAPNVLGADECTAPAAARRPRLIHAALCALLIAPLVGLRR